MSFLAPKNALSVIRGATKVWSLAVTDPEGKAFDLTGATVYFSVKGSTSDDKPLILKSSEDANEIQVTSAKGGTAKILLGPSDTKSLPPKAYMFDVWVVTSTGARHPVVVPSTLEVLPSVTVIR